MTNRISSGIRLITSVAVLVLLGLGINFVISQTQSNSIDPIGTESVSGSSQSDIRLIAFTSEKDGNAEIYTMRADGNNLTNITNNTARDLNPAWSPDGKHIAFESNRLAFTQIYLMDADGSNVTQLTYDQVDHEMTMNYAQSNPWSPDGGHLLFFQRLYGEKGSTPHPVELYSIDINGGNKIMLASGNLSLFEVSWSPDGKHIAFIIPEPHESLPENRELSRIYVVNADGSNLTNITASLPMDEDIYNWDYSWSSDGQSIFFIADRYTYENGNGKSTLYEASLDGTSLNEIDHVGTHMADWWNGTAFIDAFASPQPLTWLRPDGTNTTLNPFENCEVSDTQYGPAYKRAPNGNLIIGAGCVNNDWWFYWASSDGTVIEQLLSYPIQTREGFVDIAWSPDARYVVLNAASSNITNMYILNVEEALRNPSIKPLQITIDGDALYYLPAWRPLP